MDNMLADFSILWRKVGMLNDFSKILIPDYDFSKTTYTQYIYDMHHRNNINNDTPLDEIYTQFNEDEVINKLKTLEDHWNKIVYDVDEDLSSLLAKHETLIRDMSELTIKDVTLQRNFKSINQNFNNLTLNKSLLKDKIYQLEEMYSNYSNYVCNERELDELEGNNEIISMDDGLDYIRDIGIKLTTMLRSIDNSLLFFNLHNDYYESDEYIYKYEVQKNRIYTIIKSIFIQLYTIINNNIQSTNNISISEIYNKYNKIGNSIKYLLDYYTDNINDNDELLQLQMYYITNRIKIINQIIQQQNNINNIQNIVQLYNNITNLEIITYHHTFPEKTSQVYLI